MKMNMKVLILTGILTARTVAYDPCPTENQDLALCCRVISGEVGSDCAIVVGEIANITAFEEVCQDYPIPRCCQHLALGFGINCTDPVGLDN
ncbi:hypothetical protein A0O28_0036380 [Trichoderma guizhouense]|uniref:Hydrophobin n=1 Tax=Trichoderma guizhouense TaxID=1491466 RepID=A0A1T3CNA4_9HYPO|nr:hypothetical protein A0O28_0036380 [Trichoderma guizhouense]